MRGKGNAHILVFDANLMIPIWSVFENINQQKKSLVNILSKLLPKPYYCISYTKTFFGANLASLQ